MLIHSDEMSHCTSPMYSVQSAAKYEQIIATPYFLQQKRVVSHFTVSCRTLASNFLKSSPHLQLVVAAHTTLCYFTSLFKWRASACVIHPLDLLSHAVIKALVEMLFFAQLKIYWQSKVCDYKNLYMWKKATKVHCTKNSIYFNNIDSSLLRNMFEMSMIHIKNNL